MMFKGCSLGFIDVKDILSSTNQEDLFLKYMGIYPELNKFYFSPFRYDKSPGCRFKWYNGLLYFVENTMFQNKLYWNIFDIIQYFNSCNFKQALHIISNDYEITKTNKVNSNINKTNKRPEIRFIKKEWPDDNLFMLPGNILEKENIYLVDDYWICQHSVIKNGLHNPKKVLTVAYYFPDTNHVKLYFPYETINKWYSNCDINDIFGKEKVDYYSNVSDTIIITKSQKDRIFLDYHLGYAAIALQNEGSYMPDDYIDYLKSLFNNIIILFDNDESGIKAASKLSNKYKIPYELLNSDKKDIYDNYITYGKTFTNHLIKC